MRTPHFIGYLDHQGVVQIYAYHDLVKVYKHAAELEQAGNNVYAWLNVPDNTPTIAVQRVFAEKYNVDVAKVKTTEPEAQTNER